jgi:hypothetical protein
VALSGTRRALRIISDENPEVRAIDRTLRLISRLLGPWELGVQAGRDGCSQTREAKPLLVDAHVLGARALRSLTALERDPLAFP